jgi:DNA-binding GntR family transcriptional regulator
MALSTDLFSSLRKDILQGRLRQGEKLTEQQVCDEYKVSRTPVREAFKQLELEGFIETIPNRGAFVSGFTPQDIRDMYELRKSYEILAVRWAIERITKDEYEKLEEAFEFMEFYTQKKDVEKMLNINMNFHDLIYKASHNRMLYRILSSFQLYIKQSRPSRSESSDTYLDEVLQEHRAIFEAFRDEDPDAAEAAVARHLDNAKQRAKSVLWQD